MEPERCPTCHRQYARRPSQQGEANWSAKLNPGLVRAIRRRRAQGETIAALAADYGVTESCIGQIVRRQTWRHVE